MAFCALVTQVNGSVHNKRLLPPRSDHLKTSLSSTFKPFLKELQQLPMKIDVSKSIKNTSGRMLDAFVDSTFRFLDQPLLPSQSNFAPVEEIGEAVEVTYCIVGEIPADFPEGVYIRNGPNPKFGGLKSAFSIFGKTSQIWVEGEGMLHALYLKKNAQGNWTVAYKNKYVETETFKIEKERNKPLLLPNLEGDSLAVLMSNFFNLIRFGVPAKHYHNVSVFEHSGKVYASVESDPPQEIDVSTLESLDYWTINGDWNGPFVSHPKKPPGSGELVTLASNLEKPYCVVGVVSADGQKLLRKVDVKLKRSVLSHEIGVTQNYNVIIDHPLTINFRRLALGDSLIKYEKGDYARIGVMPRYGDADTVKWFEVEPNITCHLVNCFEEGDEVVVRGCKALEAIFPGPDHGRNKFEWFSRGFKFGGESTQSNSDGFSENKGYLFTRVYEWRLNMLTGEVEEKYLTGTNFSMDFPIINGDVTGLKHKYAYTQVIDPLASADSGWTKYGAVAKLHFDEGQSTPPTEGRPEQPIASIEYHKFPENTFCTGCAFVAKQGGADEDDGWIVTYVHNEDNNVSQVYIIDAKKFEGEPTAIITLPQRVPYGHHGSFISLPSPA